MGRDEVCGPLGITYFCGIPEPEQANYKFADMVNQPPNYTKYCEDWPAKLGLLAPHKAAARKLIENNPGSHWLIPAKEWLPNFYDTPEGRAAEIPSAGQLTNARSMAKVNACMANGGKLGNVRIMSEKACADSMAFWISKFDPELNSSIPISQGGFGDWARAESSSADPIATKANKGFVGWTGLGGSFSLWNPEKHVAVSYVMNGMLGHPGDRNTKVMCALASIISLPASV